MRAESAAHKKGETRGKNNRRKANQSLRARFLRRQTRPEMEITRGM